jgi:ATP-dependent helicase HrpB
LLVLPLHGDLSPAEQDRAVNPTDQRKVILSTNVAESSVTIEGVTAVIDSGLARVAADSPWTGLPSVEVRRISQASATQRAGRAGRTAPGRVIRLYSAEDIGAAPGGCSRDPAARAFAARSATACDGHRHLDWLDRPPQAAFDAANELLDRLGVTPEMADLPLPPRLAKLVLEAPASRCPPEGLRGGLVLSAGERGSADLLTLADPIGNHRPARLRQLQEDRRAIRETQVDGDSAKRPRSVSGPRCAPPPRWRTAALRRLGAFSELGVLVAVDIEERREHGLPFGRLAAPIEARVVAERATERLTLEWNRTANASNKSPALMYDQLVIEESRRRAPEKRRGCWHEGAQAGIGRFADADAVEQVVRERLRRHHHSTSTRLCRACERGSFKELERRIS